MGVEKHSVVIIGAGPAGLAAAMQLTRQGHTPLVLERERVGGLLWNANLVENYPGFVGGITGPELVAHFQEQAQSLGVQIVFEEAQVRGYQKGEFRIGTNEREVAAQVLVVATGTKAKILPENILEKGVSERVFSEVYPLLDCKGKQVVIIGGGDAAFDYALNLANENHVIILNRGQEIKALGLLVDRAQEHPRISYRDQTEVKSIQFDQERRLNIRISTEEDLYNLAGDYLIAAIGREPETGFATPSIMKEIERLQDQESLYLIGDYKNGSYRQTGIAVGDGIRAAMEINHLLTKEA